MFYVLASPSQVVSSSHILTSLINLLSVWPSFHMSSVTVGCVSVAQMNLHYLVRLCCSATAVHRS